MTPTKINQTIAQACGWKPYLLPEDKFGWKDGQTYGKPPSPSMGDWMRLPNYHGDLNAMHKAVLANADKLEGGYQSRLREIVMRDATPEMKFETYTVSDIFFYHATAAQRAEAFLKVLGLWEDGE